MKRELDQWDWERDAFNQIHTRRNEEGEDCKNVLEMAVPGKRKLGIRTRSWNDCFKVDMRATGVVKEDVEDRKA